MKRVFYLFAIIAIAATANFAQGTRGTIRGTVTDANKAVVPNATVRLIDAQKGTEVRRTTTNGEGDYQFVEIEPSNYNLVVNAANFAELKINDITVEVNRNVVMDATVAVIGVTTEVEVTAGAEQIDRESPTLGTTVERQRVEGLPLNGRNVLSLALLQPGVFPTGGTLSGLGIRVNGSRGTENNVTIDGANNNEVAVGGLIGGITRPDAVQEFRLLTSNFEAEFGRNTGSIINVVTRSGTNNLHGNARIFYRGTHYAAANFFDNAFATGALAGTDRRQPFERKEYGFNVGGPVYFLNFGEGVPALYNGKDKTFFFFDYERRWQKLGGSVALSNLPSAAERAGNFSASGTQLFDPTTGTVGTPGGTPFAGNIIPAGRITNIARYYIDFIPAANAAGQALASNNNLSLVNYVTGRFDHNFTSNQLLNFTYNHTDQDTASGSAFGGTNIPGFGSTDLRSADNYVTRFTSVISSNLINTFLFNYSVNDQPSVAPVNHTSPAQIGFAANFVAEPKFAGPPFIQFYDRGFTLGNTVQGPQARVSENFQFQDAVSWVVGNHRLKFGADYVKYRQHTDFLFVNQGIFGYSAIQEEGSNTTGDDFADFLIGNTPITVQYGAAGKRDYRQQAFAGFVQDNWRVTKNLALSLGLRYEFNSPLTDNQNRVAYYRNLAGVLSQHLLAGDLTFEGKRIVAGGQPPNGLVYVGDSDPVLGGKVPDGGIQLDRNNFAPRFGVAYSISGGNGFFGKILGESQTVIRGGIGWFNGAIIGDTALQQLTAPAYNGTNSFLYHPSGLTTNGGFGPDPYPNYRYGGGDDDVLLTLDNPFTSTADIVIPASLSQMSQPIDPRIETPVVMQYNFTIERSFLKNYVFGASYVGNRGRKLYVQEQINPSLGTLLPTSLRIEGPAVPVASTANAASRRRNNDIPLSLSQLTTKGKSQYDALEVNFQKRFSDDGLTFQLAYTFSKSLNDSDTQRGGIDIIDQRAGWARSSDDYPHRLVGSFIYELPFFRNTGGAVKRFVDGWSVGAIYTYQSGSVFSVGNPFDTTGTGGGVVSNIDLNNPIVFTDPRSNPTRSAFNADAFIAADCRVINTTTGVLVPGQNFDRCINSDGTKGRRGTMGRNAFRLNNPTNNWDAIVTKRIKLWNESSNLELRFEAFNLLNYTQFTGINLTFTPGQTAIAGAFNPNYKKNIGPAFGTYTSAAPARSIQFGARLNF